MESIFWLLANRAIRIEDLMGIVIEIEEEKSRPDGGHAQLARQSKIVAIKTRSAFAQRRIETYASVYFGSIRLSVKEHSHSAWNDVGIHPAIIGWKI
jgi:hypothetical protein